MSYQVSQVSENFLEEISLCLQIFIVPILGELIKFCFSEVVKGRVASLVLFRDMTPVNYNFSSL